MSKNLVKLLYRSFDEELTKEEKSLLEKALHESKNLRDERDKIILLRKNVSASAASSFKPFFAEQITNRITGIVTKNSQPDFFSSLSYVFRRVAIGAAIVFTLLFSANLIEGKFYSFEKKVTSSEMSLDDVLATTFTPSLEDIL